MKNIISKDKVLPFFIGGRAEFILENTETGNNYRYKIIKSKNIVHLWNIYNNNKSTSSEYMGCLYEDHIGHLQYKNKWPEDKVEPIYVKAISYYLKLLLHNIDSIPDAIIVYHLGVCSKCGKKLKDPESIKIGIGPYCITRI